MPGVGAIGFLLGGGLSSLSSRYGFGADMVSVWEVREPKQSFAPIHVKYY